MQYAYVVYFLKLKTISACCTAVIVGNHIFSFFGETLNDIYFNDYGNALYNHESMILCWVFYWKIMLKCIDFSKEKKLYWRFMQKVLKLIMP